MLRLISTWWSGRITRCLLIFFCLAPFTSAQQYTISTIAGIGRLPLAGAGGPALNVRLIEPYGVATDSIGNIFVSDQYYLQVFKIDSDGNISVYAGSGAAGSSGDSGEATAAQFGLPGFLATDAAGDLYIADSVNGNVRKVTPDGTITTATNLGGSGVTLDAKGNLYVSGGNTIHVVHPDGTTALIAGTGKAGYSGDKGGATSAQLSTPLGLRLDANGNLFVADFDNDRIRQITPQGVITTVAGNGVGGTAGNNGPATAASLNGPQDVALDAAGNLYVAEYGNVRVVDKSGLISMIVGGGISTADGPANEAYVISPHGITIDDNGGLVIAVGDNKQVRRVSQGSITTVAGLSTPASPGENVPAISAALLNPIGIDVDGAGNLYIADWADERIRTITPAGTISTLAGIGLWGRTGDNGPATLAEIGGPYGLGFDATGNLYLSNVGANNFAAGLGGVTGDTVRRIAPDGTITTFAGGGNGALGPVLNGATIGDAGKATLATLNFPRGIAVDSAGNVYIADNTHHRIRRVDPTGTITTFAGTGAPGYAGDNGPAVNAVLFSPSQIAIDRQDNLYVADTGNNRIRKIAPGGIITTFAGTGALGATGDGGPAVNAQLNAPVGVAVDAPGNVYLTGPPRIRKVDAATGTISTIAGTGILGFSGDGGPATSAQLNQAMNLTVDAALNVYFTESGNLRVRKLTPQWITAGGVLNGASLVVEPVSAGEIVAIQLSGFDPTQTGIQVTFDGNTAPMISTQPNQVVVIVPYEVDGQTMTQLQIAAGAISGSLQVPVAATAPGIFTQDSSGRGLAAIANADSTVNSPANPAAPGSQVTIAATGEGQTNPPGVDGQITPDTPPIPVQAVSVQIGGVDAPVISAGGTPNQPAGYFQVVVQVPDGAPSGDAIPVVLTVGGVASQPGVTIAVQSAQ